MCRAACSMQGKPSATQADAGRAYPASVAAVDAIPSPVAMTFCVTLPPAKVVCFPRQRYIPLREAIEKPPNQPPHLNQCSLWICARWIAEG